MEHIKSTLNNMGLAVPSSPVTWDQFKPPPRPWLKRTRLSRTRGESVRAIADRWESEETYTANLEQAILLQDAVNRGDLDAVRQLAPLLVAALESKQKQRRSLSSYRSRSIKREESKEEVESELERTERLAKEQEADAALEELGQAALEETGADWRVDKKTRNELEKRHAVGCTGRHVHAAAKYWTHKDWRGLKGDPFMFGNLLELIGRMLTQTDEQLERILDGDAFDPYLNDSYYLQRQAHREAEAAYRHDPGGAWEQ